MITLQLVVLIIKLTIAKQLLFCFFATPNDKLYIK